MLVYIENCMVKSQIEKKNCVNTNLILDVVLPQMCRILAGLKIMAGHRTMSDQDDYLSGQNLGLAVILTGQVRGFQIIH